MPFSILQFFLLFVIRINFLIPKETQEHIVTNLNRVDIQQPLTRRDECKVNSMSWHPHGPASHNSCLQISLNLVYIIIKRFALHHVQVTEEHKTKDWVPNGLVNGNLCGYGQRCCSGEFAIEKSVEVMTGGTVDEEAEGSHTKGTHGVVGFTILVDEFLGETKFVEGIGGKI